MKKYLIAAIAFVFQFQYAEAQPKSKLSPLIGTWQMVSAVFTTKDTTIMHDSSTIRQIKIVSPERFMFIVMKKSNDSLMQAATGRVAFSGKTYTEIIEHSNIESISGKSYRFTVNIVGDKWFHRGKVEQWNIDEVWTKVK
jgi:hypothetical protein